MKKRILFLTLLSVILVSCNCPFGRYDDYGFEEEETYGISYRGDKFTANKLLGTWDCYYPMIMTLPEFGKVEIKSMIFNGDGTVDIEIVGVHDTDRGFYTFDYLYTSKTIKFTRNGNTIVFSIIRYVYPELFIKDSLKEYTMKKVKSYGC